MSQNILAMLSSDGKWAQNAKLLKKRDNDSLFWRVDSRVDALLSFWGRLTLKLAQPSNALFFALSSLFWFDFQFHLRADSLELLVLMLILVLPVLLVGGYVSVASIRVNAAGVLVLLWSSPAVMLVLLICEWCYVSSPVKSWFVL